MKRNITDVNTPENYDEIYFGSRTNQLMPHQYALDLLKQLNRKNGKVLDVGCGLGRYFPAFEGNEIYGTELSLKTIEKTKQDYPNAHISQWFAGTPFPYEDNFFNLIWCGEFLEHIDDPQQVIDEIYRVMTLDGIAIFATPVGENSKCPEHLWFFNKQDIDSFFSKYPHKKITTTSGGTKFLIILTKLSWLLQSNGSILLDGEILKSI